MNKLLSYYQKELSFLKEHGKIFSGRFPKIARRLGIVEGESEDPHISRLIESFALLTSRIHQRLDDDMPNVIEALVSTLAPQYLRPLPSACIVMIKADPQRSGITGKNEMAAGTALFTKQSEPVSCQFQTVYPVTILPLSLNNAALRFNSDELSWQLNLHFQVWPAAKLGGEKVRLHLHGPENAVQILYTLLCSQIKSLSLQQQEIKATLSIDAITPVGFSVDEALLSRDARIAPPHILLLDYFWFPQKFSFIDIELPINFNAKSKDEFTLNVVFNRNPLTEKLEKLAELVDVSFFRMHCTPAINLFPLRAEPIVLSDSHAEYPIIPDSRNQTHIGVWAVQEVSIQRKVDNHIDNFLIQPLLESHYCNNNTAESGLRWQCLHREIPSEHSIEQKQYISFSEVNSRLRSVASETVTISIVCSNNSLAHSYSYGNPDGDFDVEIPIAGLKIVALTHPTRPVDAPSKNTLNLRFISQLSLNHQLLDGDLGVQRLKETLALYNYDAQPEKFRLYHLIQSISTKAVTTRLISNDPHSLARGIEITLTFSHRALQEPEYYLLCCLLDRLLGLYAPVNSFTRLITCIEREEQSRRLWPIRAGKLSWL
ncbi:type VI secretion system baseplate subunit TssF [Enterobacteriaceae bacterium RIT711]|nr:type VI secretion system baseplate subunit TssF [Enterobacteriaceae bacterium RIT711]